MFLNNYRFKLILFVLLLTFFWLFLSQWLAHSKQTQQLQVSPDQQQQQQQQPQPKRVLITVYYEALCPDSRNFVVKQLLPTYEALENRIRLLLIPYGKAETFQLDDGKEFKFKCQHGEAECQANIIHACAIDRIGDSRRQLELIACMIRNNIYPAQALSNCASRMQEFGEIDKCSRESEGRRLLAKYGEVTSSRLKSVGFIPTITLDDKVEGQVAILKNLLRQVCLRLDDELPEACLGDRVN